MKQPQRNKSRTRTRAEVAMRALKQVYPRPDQRTAVIELLRDLQHFCHWKNLDFDGLLESADDEFDSDIEAATRAD